MIFASRLAIGLSSSSWPLLQRLKRRAYVDDIALTAGAASVLKNQPKDLFVGSAAEIISKSWDYLDVLIVIGAIGAVTRLVAPHLESKEKDPAVVVIDSNAFHVVPLLGGHSSGAEELATELSEDFGGKAVLTGDSSSQRHLSLDSFGKAWGWKRKGNRKSWDALMLKQAKGLDIQVLQNSGTRLWLETQSASNCKLLDKSDSHNESFDLFIGSKASDKCSWHPATLWIGIGCERNTSEGLLERSLMAALDQSGLAQESIAGFASIELKADETALLAVAEKMCLPIKFFSSESLSKVKVPNPSKAVVKEIGIPSVAEASALLAAGNGGILLQEKSIYQSRVEEYGALTIAISEAQAPFAPHLGELHLVGSGPGDPSYLTNDARLALSRSSVWVGYQRYLDQLENLRRDDQVRIDGELTKESERCMQAIELACQGTKVALISSGESGIYGMAGLALELLLNKSKNDRPKFKVHPGLTAMQMAASRIGAPLMDDFCAVSLSDRLTPWSKIEERLLNAVMGDFVIALYNPQSIGRNWQLRSAIDLLLKYRSLKTPVALARQLCRQEEKVQLFTLETIPIKEVDMLTVLIIGNSRSLINDGWFVTPRGYSI